ncbi:MAG: PAS domain-containing protein [Chloroflexi bacterium]|nr:PAS domain-containing protein [Chloroflexota bacterium]
MSDQNDATDALPDFPIVALCASAGGLQAFETFFDAMPPRSGLAFVVVQHLASQQESILHDLIQRHTDIVVQPIKDDVLVKVDNVYVLPSRYALEFSNGHLQLVSPKPLDGWPRTIDRFLKSLAEGHGQLAGAVILSGAGSDGLEGARAVKRYGGLVFAQDPESAAQNGMPSNIIESGLADAVLVPGQMPEALLRHFEITPSAAPAIEEIGGDISDVEVEMVIRRLQRQTERDFSNYKYSTLRRQIARRMGIHQFDTIDDYLEYINDHPGESQQLARYLLINVTSFFRDPEAFESLKVNALEPALRKLDIDSIFRVWVPGVASGEEAISIAIVIHECLRELDMPEMQVRIFATDVKPELLQRARSGLYPQAVAEDITPSRLRDHFIEEDKGYRVRNHIDRMLIWSEHNLVEHPPFSNLHLISCRNVLIYFQRRLQERVFALFQFALRPEGTLFLGPSETMPHETDAFAPIDSKHRIYRRKAGPRGAWLRIDQPLLMKVPDYAEARMPKDNPPQTSREDRELEVIKRMLVEYYDTTCAIVNEFYQVRYTFGEIDRYLRIVAGREGQHNILDMVREGLDVELTIALHEAFETDKVVVRKSVWVKTNGDERIINLIVKPIVDEGLSGNLRLIIFEMVLSGENRNVADGDHADGEEGATIKRLRQELQQSQKALQNVTQALQAKSEELTSSMEEIRSANEEVQTTNEELRTSKEELESMNEELNTLNTQLTDQNAELTRANNTLHNFLQSTEIGMIFLDQDMAIREYTAAVTDIFGLRPSDMGRPLAEIANQLAYPKLIEDAESVLDTLNNVEKDVQAGDGRWFNVRIRPYRTTNNVIDGLVLTFSDIADQKQAQAQAEKQASYMRQVFDTIENSLLELNGDLRVVGANNAFYEKFQVAEEDTIGQMLYDLGNGQWDIPELRRLLNEIIPQRTFVREYEVSHDFPDLGQRTMRLNARQIAELNRILLVITDISAGDG